MYVNCRNCYDIAPIYVRDGRMIRLAELGQGKDSSSNNSSVASRPIIRQDELSA